jgi:hypothetical protein
MANNFSCPLKGWIPYKITVNNSEAGCHWIDTNNLPYTDPFFEETIAKLKGVPRKSAYKDSVSDLSMLTEWAGQIDHIDPTAFIFHISRCGSTLISQLFGLDKQNVSLSEVPIFDDILRLRYKIPQINDEYINKLLKAALKFYGQKRTGVEQHLFIKTDSWHIHFYKQLRELYPDTPFVLLYRTPNEVFESHTKVRGMQTIPGLIEAEIFGFNTGNSWDLDAYTANVLSGYLKAYLKVVANDKLALLINYSEGIMSLMDKITSFAQIEFSPAIKQKMNERSSYHSKHPGELFSEKLNMIVPAFLGEALSLYQQVEQKRLEKHQ